MTALSPTLASVALWLTSTPTLPAALSSMIAPEAEARTLMRFSSLSALTVTSFAALMSTPSPAVAEVLLPETVAAKVPPAAGPFPATSMEVVTRIRSERFFARMLTLPAWETRLAPSPTEAFTLLPERMISSVPPMVAAVLPAPRLRTPATVTAYTSFFASAIMLISSLAVMELSSPTLALILLWSSKPAMFMPTPMAVVTVREPPMMRLLAPLFASTVALPPVRMMLAPSSISAWVVFLAKSMENAPVSATFSFILSGLEVMAPAMDSI